MRNPAALHCICLQIWPALPAPAIWPSSMPPLLSPKVKRIAQLLAEQQAAEDARLEQAGKEDRWASIVFVETKVRPVLNLRCAHAQGARRTKGVGL